MLSKRELQYTLALQRIPNIGDTLAKKLISIVGSAEGVFKENKNKLLKIDGVGFHRIKGINEKKQLSEAENELLFIEKNQI